MLLTLLRESSGCVGLMLWRGKFAGWGESVGSIGTYVVDRGSFLTKNAELSEKVEMGVGEKIGRL